MWFDFSAFDALETLQAKFDHYNELLFPEGVPPCPLAFADLKDMAGATYYKTQGTRILPGSV